MMWNCQSFFYFFIGSMKFHIRNLSVYWTLIHGIYLICQSPDDTAHALPSSDPAAHLLPNKIKDFTAFINLVDFCR